MSKNQTTQSVAQPQQPVLDKERLNLYIQQFKKPITDLLTNFNQTTPNVIDQLITQCVTLEMQIAELQKQVDNLLSEKTLAKTIIKDKEEKPSK